MLEVVYNTEAEIPEAHRELYTEKDGKFELTGVNGIKTAADVSRVEEALRKERSDHKKVKDALGVWGDLNHEEVSANLARIPELEAQVEAGGGKIDEDKMNELVNKRVGLEKGPLERQVRELTEANVVLTEANTGYETRERTRTIHDAVRKAIVEHKIVDTAHDDVLMLAERVFDVTEDGKVLVKDEMGTLPGADPSTWLRDMQDKRPHWWPPSVGGGAGGNGPGRAMLGNNPWASETWNLTEQGKFLTQHGREKAEQYAKAAGTSVGGGRPVKKAG